MSIVLNGSTGITTPDIDSTAAPDLVGTNFTSLPSAQLTGALPALDGSALTGLLDSATLSSILNGEAGQQRIFNALAGYADIPTIPLTAGTGYTITTGLTVVVSQTSNATSTYLDSRRITISAPFAGTIRLRNAVLGGNYGSASIRLLKNGTEVVAYTQTGSVPIQRTVDIACAQNDIFQWQTKSGDGVSAYSPYGAAVADEQGSEALTTGSMYMLASSGRP
tara:strand:- start:2314 stop:2979 length:666 start_codon:yes stop_codon:yes gene_type:complete